MGIAVLVVMLILFFAYPYVLYRVLSLDKYGVGLIGVAAQHWILILMLIVMPINMCTAHYEPIREVFIASQAAYWLPVLVMRYWRQSFSTIDRIWVRFAYPVMFVVSYFVIYMYVEMYHYLNL